MIERGKDLCFPLEAREPIRIVRKRVGQDLQRDITAQLRIMGAVDFAHPSAANRPDNFVVPYA
jgi:hypothetical protein